MTSQTPPGGVGEVTVQGRTMPLAQKTKAYVVFLPVLFQGKDAYYVRFVYADFKKTRTLVVLGSSQINEHSCQPH